MLLGKAEYPFIGYNLYKVHHSVENRDYVILFPDGSIPNLKQTTISYARYLVSVRENRFLNSDETVDHIDNDKTNDSIDNLQILSLADNNRKEAKRRGKQKVCLRCPWCGNLFFKDKSDTHIIKHNSYTACSRSCNGKFSSLMHYHPDDPRVSYGLQNNVVMNYKLHAY